MKKTFPLKAAGKDDARVRDKIRHEVNKYARRELRKPLPEGYGSWQFECRVGATPDNAEPRSIKEIGATVDTVAEAGATEVYIEIIAVPGVRRAPSV